MKKLIWLTVAAILLVSTAAGAVDPVEKLTGFDYTLAGSQQLGDPPVSCS